MRHSRSATGPGAAGRQAGVLRQLRSEQAPSRPRAQAVLSAVIAAEGVAFAALAGLDGSPVWQVARVLVILAASALAVWFTRRAGRAGRGATALLLGVAGTVAGAGVASAHLAKAGLDAAAVLAAIVLAAGLILLGWGAVALVRATPDLAAAVSFLAARPGVRVGKIAVLGESMGGEQALAAGLLVITASCRGSFRPM